MRLPFKLGFYHRLMPAAEFSWDPRPGLDMDRNLSHGTALDLRDEVYVNAVILNADREGQGAIVAEGKVRGQPHHFAYGLDGDEVRPITINPIRGFRGNRRGLRRRER